MSLWTIVHRKCKTPVLPFDSNPRSSDEGMLVYRSYQAATAACKHQNQMYELDTIPARLEAVIEREARLGR